MRLLNKMHGSQQFPMHYFQGQEYAPNTQGPKDPNLEGMPQQPQFQPNFMNQMPMNPNMPMDNKQMPGFPSGNMPPPSFFQMFNNQLPPAEASKMLMDYLQSQGQNPNAGLGGQPYGMSPNFPMQGQNNYSGNMGSYNPSNNQGDQGKREYGGGGGYQNKFRNNNGGGGFRDRSDRGDRGGDRRDRGGRDDRSDRGDRGGDRGDRRSDRSGERGGDRRDRGERSDRGDRGGDRGGDRRDFSRGNQYDSNKGKRMDNFQRDKRPDRRSSRSRSRSFERRDNRKGGFGNNNYNKDREGGERYGNKGGNFNKPYDRKGGDDSSRNRGGGGGGPEFSDWKCLGCGNVNWARRDACNRCKVSRPENAPLVPKDEGRSHSFQQKGGFDQKPHQHMNNYKRNDYKNDGYRDNPSSHLQNDGGM